jgi:peptidoglycan/LPS O-acetylase OafA/YrhL
MPSFRSADVDMAPVVSPVRVRSLDGIRGIAAAVVVLHHCLLVEPDLVRPYITAEPLSPSAPLPWALEHTPLHLLWAGTEAVYVFFVLSGFVLTMAWTSPVRRSWAAYYPQRLLRLYLPVLGAVALAAALTVVVPRVDAASLSPWLQNRPAVTPWVLWRDAALVRGVSGLVSPLWSLRWEVLFSLGLPLYLWVARRWPSRWLANLACTFVLIFVGALTGREFIMFLPMFNIGVLMASRVDRLHAAGEWLSEQPRHRAIWLALSVAAALALTNYWYLLGLRPSDAVLAVSRPIAVAGAAVVVFVGIGSRRARQVFERAPLQWLGAISFSLYLVHEPIIVSIAFLAGPGTTLATVPVATALSFVAAIVFFRYVERPAHRIARTFGRRMEAPSRLTQP